MKDTVPQNDEHAAAAFKQWLSDMPRVALGEEVTIPVNITLRRYEWLWLAEAALANGMTLEEAMQHLMY